MTSPVDDFIIVTIAPLSAIQYSQLCMHLLAHSEEIISIGIQMDASYHTYDWMLSRHGFSEEGSSIQLKLRALRRYTPQEVTELDNTGQRILIASTENCQIYAMILPDGGLSNSREVKSSEAEVCWNCDGKGYIQFGKGQPIECHMCMGLGFI